MSLSFTELSRQHDNINNPFNGRLSRSIDPVEPLPEETFTHTHPVFVAIIQHLHFLEPIASSLHICWVWQSFFYDLSPSFLWPSSRCCTFHFKIHAFSPTHSHPFLKHSHTILTRSLDQVLVIHVNRSVFVMAALSADHHILPLWFLSFFFLSSFSSPVLSSRRTGCLPYFRVWSGLSANLECRSEICCMRLAGNTGRKNSPAHHRTTLLDYIFTTKAFINNRKKAVKQQYLLHMSW